MIPQEAIVALQFVLTLLSGLLIFLVTKLFTKIEENTASTNTIAVNSAKTDTKVDQIGLEVKDIRFRTHKMSEQITILETTEKLRKQRRNAGRG